MTTCDFHQTDECMNYGTLLLVQYRANARGGVDAAAVGEFCTISALQAWCLKQGAIEGARPGDLKARRPGNRAHRDQRPTVEQATRRPRKSLSPKGEE